jgi:hypothetical protein
MTAFTRDKAVSCRVIECAGDVRHVRMTVLLLLFVDTTLVESVLRSSLLKSTIVEKTETLCHKLWDQTSASYQGTNCLVCC